MGIWGGKKKPTLTLLVLFSSIYTIVLLTATNRHYKKINDALFGIHPLEQRKNHHRPPPPPSLAKNESFAACLLVMDDNIRLREWLAYHYHVLPLRKLIITVDPRSKHPPGPILKMFRKELGMDIVEWRDQNFHNFTAMPADADSHAYRERHLIRQRRFLEACMEHLHHEGYHWTLCVDTDEFVAWNARHHESPLSLEHVTGRTSFRKPGTVLSFIQRAKQLAHPSKPNETLFSQHCSVLPRVLYGAKDVEQLGETRLNPYQLDTIRWRYHNDIREKHNGLGKPIVDVSNVGSLIPLLVRNPHRVLMQVCGSPYKDDTLKGPLPFRVNHYLGSWEQYSFRDDSRKGGDKSREAWEFRASMVHLAENTTHLWLDGFVEDVGLDRAVRLLRDSGVPRNYKKENHSDWTFDPTAKSIAFRTDGHHKQFLQFVAKKQQEAANNNNSSNAR